MRETFERIATENKWYQEDNGLERTQNGYLDLYLELRWQGWKAALNHLHADVLETL
jgi:hypothetical protein